MIFTNVLILILSLVISGRYEMAFRNAAFVRAGILIRLSLTQAPNFGAAIAIFAMIFGILTLVVFNYRSSVRASELQNTRRHRQGNSVNMLRGIVAITESSTAMGLVRLFVVVICN
jgi:hypothetical protein